MFYSASTIKHIVITKKNNRRNKRFSEILKYPTLNASIGAAIVLTTYLSALSLITRLVVPPSEKKTLEFQ